MVAGIVGGMVSTSLLFPLDVIKSRYQIRTSHNAPIFHTLKQIIASEGVLALYQGLFPGLLAASVSWGGYLFFYERAKARQRTTTENLHSGHHIAAGFEAGIIMVFFTNPLWLIKTRMQLQQFQKQQSNPGIRYTGLGHALRTIIKDEGVLGLYRGVIPALVLTSHGVVQFTVYEKLKLTQPKNHALQAAHTFVIGGLSKIIAACITFPYQVVKTRIMQRNSPYEGRNDLIRSVQCIRMTWKQERIWGFFRGCWPNALRVAPSASVTFLCYEETMKFLKYLH
eukprot:c6525_g1_i1.p1 GENE.c6525_g1_i1~~c6525_g1_i1.p1  ORF type:complete len:297 (+),score=48.08 c6525_g1_i1:47-892(+)